MDRFLDYKEESGTIEPSTVRGYRSEAKLICRYIGGEKLVSVTIATVNDWMAKMSKDGYAPKSVAKPFRLLKQAMKWAVAQDLITKNPCDFSKMNGFSCTFHNLRHTFATMMIAGGSARCAHYMRTVASYLGHASVSMTLNIYADVDPDAKKAAVSKVQDCFDMDFDLDDEPAPATSLPAPGISFTVEQLEAMLQAAKAQQADTA